MQAHVAGVPACMCGTHSESVSTSSKHRESNGRQAAAQQGTSCRRQSGPRCPWPERRGPLQQQRCPPGLRLQGRPGKWGGRQAVACKVAVKNAASRPAQLLLKPGSGAGRQAAGRAGRGAGAGLACGAHAPQRLPRGLCGRLGSCLSRQLSILRGGIGLPAQGSE
jgi:hypothetical protein